MQLTQIIEALDLEVLTPVAEDREVLGGYTGDLLSWVMGRAESEMLWITIMTNVNILAVASLRDLPAVLIAEAAELDEAVIAKAKEQEITLLRSPKSAYALCVELGKLLA